MIEPLIDTARSLVQQTSIPIDIDVYLKANKEFDMPVLYAGDLKSDICVIGRDLGAKEVEFGQPLIGSGGKKVRQTLAEHFGITDDSPPLFPKTMENVVFTNTVPYKPPGNKAYSSEIRELFRPLVLGLLTMHWSGQTILTLGNEAFQWFGPYLKDTVIDDCMKSDLRYSACFIADLPMIGGTDSKRVNIMPLPHPSPLNVRWSREFCNVMKQQLKRNISNKM